MRDGMPAPGWWIASDGRWYPPELHPDVYSPVAVAPTVTTAVADGPLASSFDLHREATNGTAIADEVATTNGTAVVDEIATTNGARAAPTLATVSTPTVATPTRSTPTDTVITERPSAAREKPVRKTRPARTNPRGVIGVALALGTLAVIVSVARGDDQKPTLEASLAPTTIASSTPTSVADAPNSSVPTSPAPTGAPNASSPNASPTTPSGTATTVPTSAGRITPRVVSVFDLVKGNCLDGAGLSDGLVTTIRVVDCAEVHTHEVYYSGRYPEATFDATKIATYANDTCLAQFAPYVGIDYTRSRYQYLHIVPTQESWTRDNDRDVVCVAFEEDATITGSIANRAQ
jgi:hypothetical protein